jgi:hypothetical protein
VEPAEFIWKLFGWACFFGSDHVSINYSIPKLRNKFITIISSKSMREKESWEEQWWRRGEELILNERVGVERWSLQSLYGSCLAGPVCWALSIIVYRKCLTKLELLLIINLSSVFF